MLTLLRTFPRKYRIPMAPLHLTGGQCPQGTREGGLVCLESKVMKKLSYCVLSFTVYSWTAIFRDLRKIKVLMISKFVVNNAINRMCYLGIAL